jgi:NAD(P)-dependent dehydrogenase (short-subunit alcohol dehydrogenase family)
MTVLLQDRNCIVYGAGGAIGGAVARAFAAEGAAVFVTARQRAPVDAVVRDIAAGGGAAEAAVVDALDEQAIDAHVRDVVERAGRIDVSFNAVGIPDATIVGVPATELDAERFALPITAYTSSYFLTARLAARHMIPNESGTIMTVSALPAGTGTVLNGGYGPAMAAKEALTRDLSAELAPHGIRVVSLRPHGLPDTPTMHELHRLKFSSLPYDQFEGFLAGTTHPKRVLALREVADVAAFLASDRASGMTGTTVNLTMGSTAD